MGVGYRRMGQDFPRASWDVCCISKMVLMIVKLFCMIVRMNLYDFYAKSMISVGSGVIWVDIPIWQLRT